VIIGKLGQQIFQGVAKVGRRSRQHYVKHGNAVRPSELDRPDDSFPTVHPNLSRFIAPESQSPKVEHTIRKTVSQRSAFVNAFILAKMVYGE